MIRTCRPSDLPSIYAVINDAATAYRGAVPDDCLHDPYMSMEELQRQIDAGVSFFGWDERGTLAGVMGRQSVRDVVLIRHAYVRGEFQGRGIGARLLRELQRGHAGRMLVGTWAAAHWAIRFYERHGFQLISDDLRDQVLRTYWTIPDRQRDVSVVLELRRSVSE